VEQQLQNILGAVMKIATTYRKPGCANPVADPGNFCPQTVQIPEK
jgi:hypothetical protein